MTGGSAFPIACAMNVCLDYKLLKSDMTILSACYSGGGRGGARGAEAPQLLEDRGRAPQ